MDIVLIDFGKLKMVDRESGICLFADELKTKKLRMNRRFVSN